MIPDLDKKVPVWLCGDDSKNIVKSPGTSISSEKHELGTMTGVMFLSNAASTWGLKL